MPPSEFRGTPSSSTRTPVLAAPRRLSCSACPVPPLCWSTTPGASPTSTPRVETSERREATSTTVVSPVGSRTSGDSGGGGAAGTGTSTGGSSTTAGDCPQAIDATLNAGPRHARAHRHPPIVRLPLSSPKREGLHRRLRRRTLGQVSWLTDGERGRRPDGAFHVLVRPPTFPRDVLSAVATDGGCRTGPVPRAAPFTVAGPRRTLTGFPVGPDMGTRGQAAVWHSPLPPCKRLAVRLQPPRIPCAGTVGPTATPRIACVDEAAAALTAVLTLTRARGLTDAACDATSRSPPPARAHGLRGLQPGLLEALVPAPGHRHPAALHRGARLPLH